MALIGATAADTRDVMVEGESGLLAVFPPSCQPVYEPSKRRVTFYNSKRRKIAIATMFSADEPARLRGPQHDLIWADELAAWRYPETWDQAQFGLRLGTNPRAIVTTTPRPTPLVKEIAKDPKTVLTRGSTFDNKKNLAQKFIDQVLSKYEGTRLGRQELHADILEDNPGALWQRSMIDANRHRLEFDEDNKPLPLPDMRRIVVAIDPAASSGEESDETGIIVAGLGTDGLGYVLADGSVKESPLGWAKAAIALYRRFGADRIVAEVNQGGEMVEAVVRQADANVAYRGVHASKGKVIRAEPVAALYEQGRIRHAGTFAKLEDQMCEWDPINSAKSPDRVDALVWAFTELMVENNGTGLLNYYAAEAAKNQSPEASKAADDRRAKLNAIFRPKPASA